MSELRDAAELTAYLAQRGPSLAVTWDVERALVTFTAPMQVALDLDRHAIALAVAQVNLGLEVFGLQLADALVFVTHLFLDDGALATTAVDRVCVAADACATRTAEVFAAARGGA